MPSHQGWEPRLKLQRSRKLLEGRDRSYNALWEPGESRELQFWASSVYSMINMVPVTKWTECCMYPWGKL